MKILTLPQAYWISLFSEIKSCLSNSAKPFSFLKDDLFEQSLLNDKSKWITPIKVNRKGIKRKGVEYSTLAPSKHIQLTLIHERRPIDGHELSGKHRPRTEVIWEIRDWLKANLPETDEECIRQIKEVLKDKNWIDIQLHYMNDLNEQRPTDVEAMVKHLSRSWDNFIQYDSPLALHANNLVNIQYHLFNQITGEEFEYRASKEVMTLKKWRTISLFNNSRRRRSDKLYDAILDLPDDETKLPNWKDVPHRHYRPFFIAEMKYRNREQIPTSLLSKFNVLSVFPIPEKTIKVFLELEREKLMKSIEYKEVNIDEATKNIDTSLPF